MNLYFNPRHNKHIAGEILPNDIMNPFTQNIFSGWDMSSIQDGVHVYPIQTHEDVPLELHALYIAPGIIYDKWDKVNHIINPDVKDHDAFITAGMIKRLKYLSSEHAGLSLGELAMISNIELFKNNGILVDKPYTDRFVVFSEYLESEEDRVIIIVPLYKTTDEDVWQCCESIMNVGSPSFQRNVDDSNLPLSITKKLASKVEAYLRDTHYIANTAIESTPEHIISCNLELSSLSHIKNNRDDQLSLEI